MADVYLDACCFIYLVEGEPAWRSTVERRIADADPGTQFVTSQLSRLECRMKPLRDGDPALLARYDALFAAARIAVVDVGVEIIDRATELRARHRLKAPDALHLATAIERKTTTLWTGDSAFVRCGEIDVELLVVA